MSREKIRRYFITGLATILPLWLTIYILWLLFKLISNFTYPILSPIFHSVNLLERGQVDWLLRLASFFLTLVIIYLAGIIASNLVGKKVLLQLEAYLLHLPVLRDIYQAIRKFIQYLFIKRSVFQEVVLVEFPSPGMYSVGFITSPEAEETINKILSKRLVNVFIPTVPNISTGFLIMLESDKIIRLNLSFDEALRLIVSGGVLSKISLHKEEDEEKK